MKGSALQEFFLDGVTCYTNYNLESNTFESAAPSIISTTEKDGYSNYIYGFFADEDNRELIFNDKENNVSFVRTFGSNALGVGKSGYLDIPTLDKRSGWTTVKFKDYSIGKVSFRMIRVVGNASYYSFFIGETEVTQALWNAVMNTNLSGDNLPVANVSYNDCLTFIAKLNAKTGENFRLPTASEWFFAAQGGNLTQGYTYSGSNSVAEVAWYSGNSNSSRHDVKTLKPNELEIYDMSGNVSEMTLASGNSFSYYGGYYSDSQNYVKCSSYSSNSSFTSASYAIGLRLLSY
ncbi:MAG: SUMF1/EgtB/PvdO family nonheme iron enzyme [Bacteroidales bacterium]|nr:SUMF1/EgtB/PvdO family nonheme iron enzyme [Bacteroidales bacterium]